MEGAMNVENLKFKFLKSRRESFYFEKILDYIVPL
jgi:hypothetical protein